ncbi:unnamed protein product [Coccothraustes coccothraustes]
MAAEQAPCLRGQTSTPGSRCSSVGTSCDQPRHTARHGFVKPRCPLLFHSAWADATETRCVRAVLAGNGRSPRTRGYSLVTDPQPPTSRDLSGPSPQQARGPRSLPALPQEDERCAAPAAAGGGGPGVRIAPATGGGPGARGVWAAAAALTSGGS